MFLTIPCLCVNRYFIIVTLVSINSHWPADYRIGRLPCYGHYLVGIFITGIGWSSLLRPVAHTNSLRTARALPTHTSAVKMGEPTARMILPRQDEQSGTDTLVELLSNGFGSQVSRHGSNAQPMRCSETDNCHRSPTTHFMLLWVPL